MKKTTRKTSYTSPEVELLVVHSEGGILTGSLVNGASIDDASADNWGDIN